MTEITALAKSVLQGDRRSLAKAITLVESARRDHEDAGERLLIQLMPNTGKSLRIGISGVPGVGKSTLIEALGTQLIKSGKTIAILAVDPSSPLSGGSVMGDRTRMPYLSAQEQVFIRPSPSGEAHGGVARKTKESILLCEAAGYDIILVETVGVGQGEYLVASMVDLFVLLHLPGSGDELQGMKKGILELADAVVVTKADGDNLKAANLAKKQLLQTVRCSQDGEQDLPVFLTSSLEQRGIVDLAVALESMATDMRTAGTLRARRREQAVSWFESEVNYQLLKAASRSPDFQRAYQRERKAVANEVTPASVAARRLVDALKTGIWPAPLRPSSLDSAD